MTTTEATAPGKVILFGEHAVVYGQPAIAVPVTQVRAHALVEDRQASGVRLRAPDLGLDRLLGQAAEYDPLAAAVRLVQQAARLRELPPLTVTVHSEIPIASGLGSGAATTAAVIRALARHLGYSELATNEQVSALTYEVEKIHHGTPSGIDNTVVAYERPVYFMRRQPDNLIQPVAVSCPLHLLIGDTGMRSATKAVVSDVRQQWEANPAHFEAIFLACGQIAREALPALEGGELRQLGDLMNENQRWLREMTVSSPELERLVAAATEAGAAGAKLSGGGRGGNMIALVTEETAEEVRRALLEAGAHRVLGSKIGEVVG